MRLLLDMGVSPRTAEHLRQSGHDAVHLREEGLERLEDPAIAAKAAAEGRILVTFDLDFNRILSLQRLAHPSVILFRLERFTTDQINGQLTQLLEEYGNALEAGAIIVVEPDRIRIRSLPIW